MLIYALANFMMKMEFVDIVTIIALNVMDKKLIALTAEVIYTWMEILK